MIISLSLTRPRVEDDVTQTEDNVVHPRVQAPSRSTSGLKLDQLPSEIGEAIFREAGKDHLQPFCLANKRLNQWASSPYVLGSWLRDRHIRPGNLSSSDHTRQETRVRAFQKTYREFVTANDPNRKKLYRPYKGPLILEAFLTSNNMQLVVRSAGKISAFSAISPSRRSATSSYLLPEPRGGATANFEPKTVGRFWSIRKSPDGSLAAAYFFEPRSTFTVHTAFLLRCDFGVEHLATYPGWKAAIFASDRLLVGQGVTGEIFLIDTSSAGRQPTALPLQDAKKSILESVTASAQHRHLLLSFTEEFFWSRPKKRHILLHRAEEADKRDDRFDDRWSLGRFQSEAEVAFLSEASQHLVCVDEMDKTTIFLCTEGRAEQYAALPGRYKRTQSDRNGAPRPLNGGFLHDRMNTAEPSSLASHTYFYFQDNEPQKKELTIDCSVINLDFAFSRGGMQLIWLQQSTNAAERNIFDRKTQAHTMDLSSAHPKRRTIELPKDSSLGTGQPCSQRISFSSDGQTVLLRRDYRPNVTSGSALVGRHQLITFPFALPEEEEEEEA